MKKFKWRNGFALGLFLGICLPLIVFIILGSVPVGGDNSTSDWLSSMAGISSVVISLVAVLLVSSTLKTSEETLHATKELGLNQTRAWVLVESVKIVPKHNTDTYGIQVVLKNFGQSPATNLCSEVYVYNDSYPFWARSVEKPSADFSISDLPPAGTFSRIVDNISVISNETHRTQVRVSFTYKILDGNTVEVFDTWVVCNDDQGFHARKFMPVDSINWGNRPGS